MNGVIEVSPREEVGEAYRGPKSAGQADKAVNVANRNKLVRQPSQDHEPNEEMSQAPSDGPSLTHSDSGQGPSLRLGESQDEDNNITQTVHRSVSHPGADKNNHETPRRLLSHGDSGHGKSFVLGESQDEEKTSRAFQRSASQPGNDTKGHETSVRLVFSGYAQGQFLTLDENQHKTLHSIQSSASEPCPGAQSHEPPRRLTHSDSGHGPSLGESQEEESIYRNDVKSPSSSGVVSNGDSGGSRANDTMNYLDPHHGTENIDSGIEKTPSIPGKNFPFPPKMTNTVHGLEIVTSTAYANQIVNKNDIGTRDQKKKELEGPVYLGISDPSYSFTNKSKSLSTISSEWSGMNLIESSISSPECSDVTSLYCSDVPESSHSIPCPPMVSKSSFDQLSREFSRTKEVLSKEIETLQKSLAILKKENDEKKKEILSLMNSAEKDKTDFARHLSCYREQNQHEHEINIQLSGKIDELNNLLQYKNKYIEQIEKERNEFKIRNDIVEEQLEVLWMKEQQRQENVPQDQELNLSFRQNVSSVDDTIPKEPFSSAHLNIKSLPK